MLSSTCVRCGADDVASCRERTSRGNRFTVQNIASNNRSTYTLRTEGPNKLWYRLVESAVVTPDTEEYDLERCR